MSHISYTYYYGGIDMRKVILTMAEHDRYTIIKNLVDNNGNKKRAAIKLGCSERTIYRYIAGYKAKGKEFFCHGNHKHKPITTIPQSIRQDIIQIYNSLYYDANFIHFHELLRRYHPEIPLISLSTLRNIFKECDILSPKAHKETQRNLRKKDRQAEKQSIDDAIEIKLHPANESKRPHPRKPRARYTGEKIYMDASIHLWFGSKKAALHAAIDDSTGMVTGLFFCEQETLQGYYEITAQMLRNYGIPARIQTDGRTVFAYKKAGVRDPERDTPTQYAYACKQLGIDLQPGFSAEAQGKVERLFQTLQSRLPVEFRRLGIDSIEAANEYVCTTYLEQHNQKHLPEFNNTTSVFETQLSEEDINLTLAVLSHRVVDKGHCISFHNRYYQFIKQNGSIAYLKKGSKVLVIKALDGTLYASCNDSLFKLQEIPARYAYSMEFDPPKTNASTPKREKTYIPPMRHPWRSNKFSAFEDYRAQFIYSFDEVCYTTHAYKNEL